MRNHLRRKLKKLLYNKCPGIRGSFYYFGTRIYFPKNSSQFFIACDQGVYELENVRTLISLIRPNTTYFDVGANIGLLSIPVLYQEPTCTVVSFEPSPNAVHFLKKTIQNSKYKERWYLVEKAAGDTVGETVFSISSPEFGAFDGPKNTQRVKMVKDVQVPITTLDYEWEILGKPRVSVIKVDVEGSEPSVILGALSLTESEKPFMLVEWNATNLAGNGYKAEFIFEIMDKLKYAVFSLPNRVRIRDLTDLTVHMQCTESFLLAPRA
jgi:FkbM family methyltransferase